MRSLTFRKTLAGACLVVLAMQPVAYAQTQTLETHPEFDVGDKWTYRYTNIGDRKEPVAYTHQAFKSENGSGWIYGEALDPSAKRKSYILRYDYKRGDVKEAFEFNAAKPRMPGKRYNNLMPVDDRFQFPLAVGKEYKFNEEWSNGDGFRKYDVKIEAFERIKVEAGEFDAFRIKFSGRWTRTEDGAANGESDLTYWYAPSAKRAVKIDYLEKTVRGSPWSQSSTELIQWEPKAPLAAALASRQP
jgi:hypothetical protein